MKLMIVPASTRKDSLNKKLAKLTAEIVGKLGVSVDFAEFSEFNLPLYDGDQDAAQGIPANGKKFIERMQAADALIIASPEYNYSTPGSLKNLIDWVSRVRPMPWSGQHIMLMSASPALAGGHRGLLHTRVPLEGCGAFVFPDMFCLGSAHSAFNPDGNLIDPELQKRLHGTLEKFIAYLKKLQC